MQTQINGVTWPQASTQTNIQLVWYFCLGGLGSILSDKTTNHNTDTKMYVPSEEYLFPQCIFQDTFHSIHVTVPCYQV